MANRRLNNYLRSHRKSAGLSQDEMAYLLGMSGGPKISRYERASRTPSLETVFAYEALLGIPARELFAGMYGKVEAATKRRARELFRHHKPSPGVDLIVIPRRGFDTVEFSELVTDFLAGLRRLRVRMASDQDAAS